MKHKLLIHSVQKIFINIVTCRVSGIGLRAWDLSENITQKLILMKQMFTLYSSSKPILDQYSTHKPCICDCSKYFSVTLHIPDTHTEKSCMRIVHTAYEARLNLL